MRCNHCRFAAATDLMAELHALHVALALNIDWANATRNTHAAFHTVLMLQNQLQLSQNGLCMLQAG